MRTILLSLATLALAGAAQAQTLGSSAALQQPVDGARRTIVDGVQWRCAGQACVAVGEPASQPVLRACRRFASVVGPVTGFTYAGRQLAADQLSACNTSARSVVAVSAPAEAR